MIMGDAKEGRNEGDNDDGGSSRLVIWGDMR